MGRLTHRTGAGGTYFVTTKAWQSVSVFQVEEVAEIVIAKLMEYRDKQSYLLHDFVLMPNHLHWILTPADSVSLEKCVQLVKGGSSFDIHKVRGNKIEIWQSGFHESGVRNCLDYEKASDYIRFNPVTAKLVLRPENWALGSASGRFQIDPIPQGLKPPAGQFDDVGPKGPTPFNAGSKGLTAKGFAKNPGFRADRT